MKLFALRWCSPFLLFLFSLDLSQVVWARPNAPLTIEQRNRLEKGLADSTLSRWQRNAAISLLGRSASAPSNSARGDPALSSSLSADGEWSPILLEGISGHAAIYDPLRDRMLVFGGAKAAVSNDVWALSMSGNPPWTKIAPTSSFPTPRAGHTAIYDPLRDRMLIFGGYGGGFLNDVWALSLAGSPSWEQLAPTGTPPAGGWGYSAIYDALRDRMIVYGSSPSSVVWALSLSENPEWTMLVTAGTAPAPRSGHTAIYDSVRDRMVIFGGDDGESYYLRNDTWALALDGTPTWTVLDMTAAVPGRAQHTAIYDAGRDRMVVFGGTNVGGHSRLNDAWAFSLSGAPTWTQLSTTSSPQARLAHVAIYDPLRARMVIFGGDDDVYLPDLNDVWSLTLLGSPEWTPGPGAAPAARNGHTAVYDRARDRMIVFAGYYDLNDVWALSLSGSPVWTQLAPGGTPPPGGDDYTAIYDPVRGCMVVFGGSDTWALSLSETSAWTTLSPAGLRPPSGYGYTAIYDPVRDRMVVFGSNDTWALSLSGTPEWTQLAPAGTSPPPRYGGHTAIYDPVRDRMVIFGGSDTIYPYPQRNDVWALSLSGTLAWTELTPTGTLATPRQRHTAIYDPQRDRMVVFGGHSHANGFDEGPWALSLSGSAEWAHLAPAGPSPGGTDGHTAIYDPSRDRMLVFAGVVDMHSDREDVWELRWGSVTDAQPKSHFVDALRPCYPNPFNPSVTIPFELRHEGNVTLSVYDVSGRLVRTLLNEWMRQGPHSVAWSGESDSGQQASSGVYFCRLRRGESIQTQKVVMLK